MILEANHPFRLFDTKGSCKHLRRTYTHCSQSLGFYYTFYMLCNDSSTTITVFLDIMKGMEFGLDGRVAETATGMQTEYF